MTHVPLALRIVPAIAFMATTCHCYRLACDYVANSEDQKGSGVLLLYLGIGLGITSIAVSIILLEGSIW